MPNFSISTKFAAVCCLFVVAVISEGAVANNLLQTSLRVKFSKEHSTRQDNGFNECFTVFNNSLPQTCNATALLDLNPTSDLSDAQLAEINRAYSRHCISSCIDPWVTYYRCLSTASSTYSSLYNFLAEFI